MQLGRLLGDGGEVVHPQHLWPKVGSVWKSQADLFLCAQLAAIAAGFSEFVVTLNAGYSNR